VEVPEGRGLSSRRESGVFEGGKKNKRKLYAHFDRGKAGTWDEQRLGRSQHALLGSEIGPKRGGVKHYIYTT